MGPGPARDAVLTAYTRSLIQTKATQLCNKPGFSRSDHDDIFQELTLRLFEKHRLFDPARRVSFNTFANRVIISATKMLLRDRRRLKRSAGFHAISLEGTTVEVSGRPVPLSATMGNADRDRRTGNPSVNASEVHETDEIVTNLLAALPPHLAEIAMRLKTESVASIARSRGTSRRQVYAAIEELRAWLEQSESGVPCAKPSPPRMTPRSAQ